MTEYRFGDRVITCSSVDRVLFPDDGVTKGEVIAYYADVAEVMLPELSRRAVTLERFTKGIAEGGFYQKHAPNYFPGWIERVELGGKTRVSYAVCDSPAALVYMANQGTVTFHVGTSRVDRPHHPDEIVFDLDPPEGRFDLVIASARRLRKLLERLELPAFVKTSGSKGVHIVVPLDGESSYREVSAFCDKVADYLCAEHPDLLTTEFYKQDRDGQLFFDTLRNAYGATVAAPYSLRGRAGAPVSAPIEWSELDEDLAPDGIRIADVRRRLDSRGDVWADLRKRVVSLAAARDALEEIAPSE